MRSSSAAYTRRNRRLQIGRDRDVGGFGAAVQVRDAIRGQLRQVDRLLAAWARPRCGRATAVPQSATRCGQSSRAPPLPSRASPACWASGSSSATSTSVRMIASGVRSSCDAFATKCRWLANAASSRASMPSKVSASSLSSSSGPCNAMRSPCRWRRAEPSPLSRATAQAHGPPSTSPGRRTPPSSPRARRCTRTAACAVHPRWPGGNRLGRPALSRWLSASRTASWVDGCPEPVDLVAETQMVPSGRGGRPGSRA